MERLALLQRRAGRIPYLYLRRPANAVFETSVGRGRADVRGLPQLREGQGKGEGRWQAARICARGDELGWWEFELGALL